MTNRPIQDFYPDEAAICYGCGRNNPHGLHIKTYWDGREGVCKFTPSAHHTAFPGFVYGGLLASLIDCHSIGTSIAAFYERAGISPESGEEITCVTGNLNVTYLKPTPMGIELVLRARVKDITDKKAVVECDLWAGDEITVKGEIVAVRIKSRLNVQGHHRV